MMNKGRQVISFDAPTFMAVVAVLICCGVVVGRYVWAVSQPTDNGGRYECVCSLNSLWDCWCSP